MAYKIGDDCLSCGACEPACPNNAISEKRICVVDPDKCTECVGSYESPQCAKVCGIGAPFPDPAHKESKEQLLAKWEKIHPGKTPYGWLAK